MRRMEGTWRRASALVLVLSIVLVGLGPAGSVTAQQGIINLSHLEFLHDTVTYPSDPPEGHETYDPGAPLDAWWTYADYDAETDTYRRVGGGAYDESTNTWGQGAYNLDDVARVAVVYLTHYRYYGDPQSLEMAYGALRHVLYMQTLTGENAGNFVIWMQPDGTLNPTPTPPDDPNPADAGFSWWAARAMWALAEGYDVFREEQPEFAEVLHERFDLAMEALDRQVIEPNYGQYINLHGVQAPAWFIGDGADASSIALIALTRHYESTQSEEARRLATALAEGIAQYQLGDPVTWAFEAHLPYARSLTLWHAWGVRMVMALARAGEVLNEPAWIASAEEEANAFLTHELVSIGPINGLLPAPAELVQINYGNEVLTNNLLALAEATGNPAYSHLAGLQATWWFGNNPAGEMMYDPATGRPRDAIEPDGSINRNAGAESVVSALLGLMNVLQDPIAAEYLKYDTVQQVVGWQLTEAESATLAGGAEAVTPESAWTGEALWSGGAYLQLGEGDEAELSLDLPIDSHYRIFVVYDKQMGDPASVAIETWMDGARPVRHEQAGAQAPGDSPNESYLWMDSIEIPGRLLAGSHTLTLLGVAGEARVDAILVQPLVEYRTLQAGDGSTVTLLKSMSARPYGARVPLEGETGDLLVYFQSGDLAAERELTVASGRAQLVLPPFGYAILEVPAP
ncbi:MAG: hypothetical protein ACYC4R_08395 [Anaerolineae bacterium]